MEVAGLAIGTVALVGVFGDCVELLSYIGAAKSMGQDYAVLATRLDIQRVLLHQWANRLNLLDSEHYDKRLDDPHIGPLISQGLDCIRQLLQDSHKLEQRYGIRPAKIHESIEPPTDLSIRLKSQFSQMARKLRSLNDVQSVHLYQSEQPDQLPNKRRKTQHVAVDKVRWIIRDKEQFEGLIQSLSELIADINAIIPPQSGKSTDVALQHEVTNLSSVSELRLIKSALPNEDINITCGVDTAIDRECAKLVLARLWFRLIDDRKDSVSEAHSETFKWAIEPPNPGSNWSDLGQWLRSGAGIYWISGKPGSGKSTLMKYLCEHSEAPELLQKWAGNQKLTMANFFLWNVGTSEQNTLDGLARGLLYHVLKKNESLIPFVLPNMWQEAQSGVKDLKLPSSTELNQAFQQLGKASTQGAFAFFIDGIDEFKGNHRAGISFIQKLATSTHIKILLSSRPIDTCVAAFRTRPQLRLQDLTKRDIEKYVNDTIRSYLCRDGDSYLDEVNVKELTVTLQEKAEGVFLWVVLACRTLLDRFDAYDSAEEIQRAVDRLPPELEDLFRSIIEDIPQGVRQQASKLLRVCYSRSLQLSLDYTIPAFALAWADENGMSLNKMKQLTRYSPNEMKQKSSMLEGRLRSRCRGLLEVHGDISDSHLTDPHDNDWPSVDFMHRTVFEFLKNTDALELDCLKIDDDQFDPTAVLACMYWYALFLETEPIPKGHLFVMDCWRLSQPSEIVSYSSAAAVIDCAVVAIKHFPSSIDQGGQNAGCHSQSPTYPAVGPDDIHSILGFSTHELDDRRAALLLAVELGLDIYIEKPAVENYNALQRLQYGDKCEQLNLLFHAISQPTLKSLAGIHLVVASPTTIEVLLDSGCDPNQIVMENEETTTPWLVLLNDRDFIEGGGFWWTNRAQVILKMLKAGAHLSPDVPHHLGDLRVFLKREIEACVCPSQLEYRGSVHEPASSKRRTTITACYLEIARAIGFQDDVELMDKIRAFEPE